MAGKRLDVPPHVPAERVIDIDTYDPPGGELDYHRAIKKIQDTCPDIFWVPYRNGHWVVTRGEDLTAILNNHEVFGSKPKVIPKEEAGPVRLYPIECDPPLHTAYRQLINPWFTPKSVGNLEARARELTRELICGFRDRGECEFVADFATHLPIAIFMNLVDLPYEDREYLMRLAEAPIYAKDHDEIRQAFGKLFEYLGDKLKEREKNPGADMLSKIATATIDGHPVSFQDKCGCATLVLIGGLDTVASTLGFVAHFLATHPDHQRQLREEPGLAKNAAEELLRRFGVATNNRILNKDFVYKGIQFKAGDQIHMICNLHGLDERCFEDPLTVNFHRKVGLHSTFGNGPHRCPGSFLARTELRVFLEEWPARIPQFGLRPGSQPKIRSGVNGSFACLPLSWPTAQGRRVNPDRAAYP
jgi:cytochrome P450